MIGKCLALLCVVFGIAAGSCLQVPQIQYQVREPSCVVSSPIVSSPVVQFSGNQFNSGIGANIISSPVVATDGPETAPLPVIQAPSVTLPTVEGPLVALPSQPIPAPRVISQRCICTKTVVKPQIIQRQVTVPKVQRYLKRTVTPIVENITYKSRPISSQQATSCGCVASAPVVAATCGNTYSRMC